MTSELPFQYQGQELDIFAHARNWKAYWASQLNKWIKGDVLEVGAGLGANTAMLCKGSTRSWLCLEPDALLRQRLKENTAEVPACSISGGTIRDLANRRFDCILYIDVLEHIEADRIELAIAASLLRSGGHLIVLSPAHQFLFSRFDSTIGHYRRYSRRTLRACSPPDCKLESLFYLDSAGVLLSLANRIFLKQHSPSFRQIQTWDRYVIPISRLLDTAVRRSFGKTVVGVWTYSGGPD